MPVRRILGNICLILILCALRVSAQPQPAEETYIKDIFQARIGELPKLGWFAPNRGFLAEASVPGITIYGPAGMETAARKTGEITVAELRKDKVLHVACELQDRDSLAVFEIGGPK